MRKTLSLSILLLLLTAALLPTRVLSGSQDRDVSHVAQNELLGTWRLAWLEESSADGKIHRTDCTGLLIFTDDAHMSVQVMYKNAKPETNGEAVQYAQGGYEASFGTYHLDEHSHTFTYHVDGGLVRTLVGKDFTRAFELSGKQMIVKSSDPSEHWRVAWERY